MNHRDASSLIPWFVNGTLGESDRTKVAAHLQDCAACREDMALETAVFRQMVAESGIEYMPSLSLKGLQSKIDRLEAGEPAPPPSVARSAPLRRPPVRDIAWAASIMVAVCAAGLLIFQRSKTSEPAPAAYHTVTMSDPRSPREVIRAVFSPTITLVELQAMLDEAQLGIISGPTEAGVYSLEAKSNRSVSTSLALLRKHGTVRFAESTQAAAAGEGPAGGAPP